MGDRDRLAQILMAVTGRGKVWIGVMLFPAYCWWLQAVGIQRDFCGASPWDELEEAAVGTGGLFLATVWVATVCGAWL